MEVSRKLKEYVESFGFMVEECTDKELKEASQELAEIEKGAFILDPVLSRKL